MKKIQKDRPQRQPANQRRLEMAILAPPEKVGEILPRVLRKIHDRT